MGTMERKHSNPPDFWHFLGKESAKTANFAIVEGAGAGAGGAETSHFLCIFTLKYLKSPREIKTRLCNVNKKWLFSDFLQKTLDFLSMCSIMLLKREEQKPL